MSIIELGKEAASGNRMPLEMQNVHVCGARFGSLNFRGRSTFHRLVLLQIVWLKREKTLNQIATIHELISTGILKFFHDIFTVPIFISRTSFV